VLTIKLVKPLDQAWLIETRRGGNHRLPTFKLCSTCRCLFGPVERLSRKYCSVKCKSLGQKVPHRRRRLATKEARRAQSMVAYQLSIGRLTRPGFCEWCGIASGRIEAAHPDYEKPLEVRWLCCSCHRKWDKAVPKNGTIPMKPREEKMR
jgi:hypothetical protein